VKVRFDPGPHTYTVEGTGVRLPSVTQALKRGADSYAGVSPAVLEAARELGEATHACIELDCAGTLDVDSIHDRVQPYFDQWRQFRLLSGAVILLSEALVYSERYGYAGKLDLLVRLNDRLALIDAKRTAMVLPIAGPQTAGYVNALRECRPDLAPPNVPIDRYALHLADRWKLVPFKDPNDTRVFLGALTFHKWELANK
jgi:hypothetical protein